MRKMYFADGSGHVTVGKGVDIEKVVRALWKHSNDSYNYIFSKFGEKPKINKNKVYGLVIEKDEWGGWAEWSIISSDTITNLIADGELYSFRD